MIQGRCTMYFFVCFCFVSLFGTFLSFLANLLSFVWLAGWFDGWVIGRWVGCWLILRFVG